MNIPIPYPFSGNKSMNDQAQFFVGWGTLSLILTLDSRKVKIVADSFGGWHPCSLGLWRPS